MKNETRICSCPESVAFVTAVLHVLKRVESMRGETNFNIAVDFMLESLSELCEQVLKDDQS
jgi:hypothetical protein